MAGRVGHRDGATLRHAQQREAFQAKRFDHRLQIGHPIVEGEIRCIPIG